MIQFMNSIITTNFIIHYSPNYDIILLFIAIKIWRCSQFQALFSFKPEFSAPRIQKQEFVSTFQDVLTKRQSPNPRFVQQRECIRENKAAIRMQMKYIFLIAIMGRGGVQMGPLGTVATNRPIVPAPGDYDDGTRAAAVRSQRLTAWATSRPNEIFAFLYSKLAIAFR
jgi:hypothetical protein